MQVFLSYPSWFILLCIALATIYSTLLYYQQKQLNTIQKPYRYILSIARFICVFFISFLLLSPFIKRHINKTEKPIIVIAQDNSSSIRYAFKKTDSTKYVHDMISFEKALSEDYDVKKYSFDEELHLNDPIDFRGKSTNISNSLNAINDIYFNRNIGAIVLISDGIYNRGINPIYTEISNSYPIYTVLLGDTTPQKDAKIEEVLYNEIVYLGDKFELKCTISSYNCQNSNASITIEQINKNGLKTKISSENYTYKELQEQHQFSFNISATSTGIQHYRISHNLIIGEFTYENNFKDIYVQVLDGRDKILLLADGAHPDISALKQAIENNKNYQLDIHLTTNGSIKIDDYNVIIFYQLPSITNNVSSIIEEAKSKNISILYLIGTTTNLQEISKIQNVVELLKYKNTYNDIHAFYNKDFSLFTVEENHLKTIEKLPPLTVPYGDFKSNINSTILFQKNGNVTTNYPLLSMAEVQQQKQGVLMGEGIWKWRMYNYILQKNYDAVDDIIQKTIQYLSIRGDKRKFKTILSKNLFNENEEVIINAQLYNDNYQLINSSDITLNLYNESNKKFTYVFSKNNSSYMLNLGKLNNGQYTYEATTNYNGKSYKDEGKFIVRAIQLEATQTKADDKMMFALSQKMNAKMVYAKDLLSIIENIKSKKDIKPIIYESYKTDSIINLKSIFFLIVFLISLEWIIRKYLGLY